MTEADRDEAIAGLIEENLSLTVQLEHTTKELGEAQLRIIHLERELRSKGSNANMRQFEDIRNEALANGRRGIFASED